LDSKVQDSLQKFEAKKEEKIALVDKLKTLEYSLKEQ